MRVGKTTKRLKSMQRGASKLRSISFALPKVFLIASLILWSLVPSGFMPTLAQDGQITMVICIGDGTIEMTFDRDGHPVEKETADKTCPFATFGVAAILPDTGHSLDTALSQRETAHAVTGQYIPSLILTSGAPRAPPSFI